jgi:hypothetical protein
MIASLSRHTGTSRLISPPCTIMLATPPTTKTIAISNGWALNCQREHRENADSH